MNKSVVVRLVICIFIFSVFINKFINKKNQLTHHKFSIPKIEKEISVLREENRRLQYIIDQFENPNHLMELSRSPEYSHLKHPLLKDVLKVNEGVAVIRK